MPFKHFLTTSLDFERTHQLILRCLFNDPEFLRVACGQETKEYTVKLEPIRGLFDIGIYDSGDNPLCLIELKMWSRLSKGQLEMQGKYLQDHNCNGMHILLGTSNLQFHREGKYDDITEKTYGYSSKIGYRELVAILNRFIQAGDPAKPTVKIAENYCDALKSQAEYLENAWLNPSVHLHFKAYSTYSKIRQYLLDESFYIYSVNNAGGAAYILNDDRSWKGFKFRGYDFQIYQEMLNLELMIRIYSKNAPNQIRVALKERVIEQLKKTDPHNLPWTFDSRTSKYHKIAMYKPDINTLDDCRHVAEVFKTLNPVVKQIADQLKDKPAA
jgi:hypothetical protein